MAVKIRHSLLREKFCNNSYPLLYLLKMKATSEELEGKRKQSSSDEEQIIVKNIDTGETHKSSVLTKDLSPINISKQTTWHSYFNSLKQLGDKLLALLMKQDHQALTSLLVQFPIDLNELHYFGGWTLLHFSVSNNDVRSANLFLKFGLDVNAQTSEMKRTALHQAVLGNKVDLVELLMGWGADPNIYDSDRNTPMHFAVDYGYFEVVKTLIASSSPIDLNIRNNQNMTPFNTCRSSDIFEILITYSKKIGKCMSKQSKQTTTSSRSLSDSYQSRLIVRNSDVIPHSSRADMVEKFLSLRQNPQEVKPQNIEYGSIISEQSYEDSLMDSVNQPVHSESVEVSHLPHRKKNRKLKKIGSELKSSGVKSSFRIASQNIGLMRESIINHHLSSLENEQVIENYDKLKKLGSGAFAKVFLVRKKRSSALYALKEIDKQRVADDGLRRYVDAERFILTQINHPFVLHAHYCFQDFTQLYILTDFCAGGDLEKIVREKPLSQNLARTYICEAALALQEIHNHGMLYRDLKAANTLLDAEGHLRLADFGLAKHAVNSGSFLGSMNYLAPQMLVKGDIKNHGKALDWYQLGIFVFELLHGLPPFYCQEREEMERRVLEDPPSFNNTLSKECIEVMEALLIKDQTKRLSSLESLKSFSWFKQVDWTEILQKKGEVLKLDTPSMKDLRKKEYFQDYNDNNFIDDKIEWYDNWNYPSQSATM